MTLVDGTVPPPLRIRLMVVLGVVVAALAVMLVSTPVTTARESPEVVTTCGRLLVPSEGKFVEVEQLTGSGLGCDEARAVVTDAVRGRDVGARRGYACQIYPPSKGEGYRFPGSGDCRAWDGGGVSWSLR